MLDLLWLVLVDERDLAVYTHVYETRGQVLIAREQFADHDGSLISYLEHNGLLGPRAEHRP
jgi:5-methylthioadenosine/S-adenosylhomocysteine deaminase